MIRVCLTLLVLALVAPALTAPGPEPVDIYQQLAGSKTTKTSKKTKTSKTTKSSKSTKAAGDEASVISTLQVELPTTVPVNQGVDFLEAASNGGIHQLTSTDCTPGDRICHFSLDEVLVCDDFQKWVTYSECAGDTFCHRLHMICVPEVIGHESISNALDSQDIRDGPKMCKPGDRRCSKKFNRVDRCNEQKDWVTYHDCRRAEFCDKQLFECMPYGNDTLLD
ncbi:hypothetical protein GGR50DRAFT_143151 [Xylaria sp. CBS 124048]|nr:hypothetical protein GGR50DRAFT_143151 [Xylaria sp. CBS 124048]